MTTIVYRNKGIRSKIFPFLLSALFFFSTCHIFQAEARKMGVAYPDLAQGFLKSASLESMDDGILIQAEGFIVSRSEINDAIAGQDEKIRRQLERNLLFLLEQETIRKVLLNEAKKAGIVIPEKNDSQMIQALFEHQTKGVTVSEEDARAFYEANKEMVGGAAFDQVEEGIRHYMLQDKKQRAVKEFLDGLSDSVMLRINEKWVDEQIKLALDNPIDKARRSGKPTLVEFGATGCVPCDMMQPILDKLRKDYPEKLNVVFIHVGEEQVLSSRFGIRSIPVQVFYDSHGKEVFRHVGFLAENEVIKQLVKMGVEK